MERELKESIDIYAIYNTLLNFTIDYIKEDSPNISNISVSVKEAVLIDPLNIIGYFRGYCTTKDLHSLESCYYPFNKEEFLKYVVVNYAYYMYDVDIVKSVLEHYKNHLCRMEFNSNDGIKVLVDFLNYIVKRCGYDHTFTPYELYVINEYAKYKREMKQLKEFLIKTGEYSKRLVNNENVNDIFAELINKLNLIYDAKNGSLYAKDFPKSEILVKYSSIYEELYALVYAYAKDDKLKNVNPENELIRKRLIEMR